MQEKEEDATPQMENIAGFPPVNAPLSEHERAVIAALREIAYGEIEVVVHNTRIVQITRSQKFRFNER
ncbi:MAG: YezD family protein [Lysobacteraceae bacterium]